MCHNLLPVYVFTVKDPTHFVDLGFVAISPRANLFASLYFPIFPTLLFVRVYNSLHIHIFPSIVQYTPKHHSFSQVSAFVPFTTLRSFRSTLSLTQNAFFHKNISSIPHSCSRRRPASTSSERLVRSMHSRQMLLGCACRVWRLGVGEHCQSVLYSYQARCFSVPFADIIYLRIHSGALSMRFRTLPLPLVGRL